MDHEFEALKRRIHCLESRNRRTKWLGILFAVIVVATAARGQKPGDTTVQAQRIQLRDEAGRLRAELSMLNGDPALRFFDKDQNSGGSLLDGEQFTIYKKGGGEGDVQATFGAHGLSFEDGRDRVFVSLRGDDQDQTGKLQLNDYRHKTFAAITPTDLSKLYAEKGR